MKREEKEPRELVYGHRAAMAVLATRPGDVARVACARALEGEIQGALRRRQARPSVEVLADRELDRLARGVQHEGLVVETRARRWASPQELAELLVARRGAAIALDRVRNSYNIGAILRSAAFFGLDAALLGAPAPHPGLDPNAVRVAEGGVEHLTMARTTDLADTLTRLRGRGVTVVGADGHASRDAFDFGWERPLVLVLGNEREGLAPRVRAACDAVVAIRGSGAIESLNVGVAAGVLAALARVRG